MGRIVWDELHFIISLLIALFILNWVKGKLNEDGASFKTLTYLLHG
jgi:hypothetical protein